MNANALRQQRSVIGSTCFRADNGDQLIRNKLTTPKQRKNNGLGHATQTDHTKGDTHRRSDIGPESERRSAPCRGGSCCSFRSGRLLLPAHHRGRRGFFLTGVGDRHAARSEQENAFTNPFLMAIDGKCSAGHEIDSPECCPPVTGLLYPVNLSCDGMRRQRRQAHA